MNVERLEKLATFMETEVPANRFDMETWAKGNFQSQAIWNCGTSACAAGWATVLFDDSQFYLNYGESNRAGVKYDCSKNHTLYSGQDAVGQYFDLSWMQCDYLFGQRNELKAPKQWASRCRRFLKEHAPKEVVQEAKVVQEAEKLIKQPVLV